MSFVVWPYRRFISVSDQYDGDRFFTEVNGVRMATPLLLALTVVELSDVVFAVDSVPAVRNCCLGWRQGAPTPVPTHPVCRVLHGKQQVPWHITLRVACCGSLTDV